MGGEGGGGLQYIGYESLEMPLPASYFQRGNNRLTVRCLDGFGIFYDDLDLTNEPGKSVPLVAAAWVEPTILYKNRSSGLVEMAKVVIRTFKPLGHTKVRVVVGPTPARE